MDSEWLFLLDSDWLFLLVLGWLFQADSNSVTHILSGEKYIVALETKLNEEVAEYQADKNLEEMAGVLEVLQAICVARGYSLDELETMRAKKADERGGFKDKVFLEYVE